VKKKASHYRLHWAFAESAKDLVRFSEPSFYDLIETRLWTLGTLLVKQDRDDFRIEKDKCKLVEFFLLNRLPTPTTYGPWQDKEQFLAAMDTDELKDGFKNKPGAFLKCCHLTIGGGRSSVTRITSLEWARKNKHTLHEFMDHFWTLQPDDLQRSWRLANNYITDNAHLTPGVMVQSSVGRMMELKVEVVWGHAYVAHITEEDSGSLLTRWPNGTFMVEVFPKDGQPGNLIRHAGIPLADGVEFNSRWMFDDPQYLQCAWDLAEYAAQAMAIDEVRVDIFVVKGDPGGCKCNEDSISSGVPYGSHFKYLAKMWNEGHSNRWYVPFTTQLAVHDLVPDDIPGLKSRLKPESEYAFRFMDTPASVKLRQRHDEMVSTHDFKRGDDLGDLAKAD